MATSENELDRIAKHRVVPVVSETDRDRLMGLADALVAGGLPVVEVALRAPGALAALEAVARRGDVLTIAGTVLSAEQVDQAAGAGAEMIVSPGFNPAVVERCRALRLAVCPGIATPTDVQSALAFGVTALKFFPAEAAGGVAMLKALAGPFPQARFMPTGGVSPGNLLDYLALRSVFACGGSWMVSPHLYENGRFDRVEAAARDAVRLAAEVA